MASLKKITQRYNKTTKTVTIMSYLQLHAVLTHIYIVSQSQPSLASHEYSNNTDQAW